MLYCPQCFVAAIYTLQHRFTFNQYSTLQTTIDWRILQSKEIVKTAVRLTAAAFLVNCCLGMSRRMRTKLDKLDTQTQLTPSQSTRYTEGGVRTSRRPHKAAKAAGTQRSPKCVNYNLVNEQEQSQPQRIHARHQGTQSPQISITLGTLSQPATDLTQRSSPEGSLVHALDCPHL